MVFSTLALTAGAVLYWAVTGQGHGFRVSTVGMILMIVGAIGFLASAVVFGASRRPVGAHHVFDREVVDAEGKSTAVHEEVR
jgi:hypothetical protein